VISTLDKLEALKPKAVVAGTKSPENDDDPRIIAETRQYLRDFNRLNTATTTARELYDAMLQIYPDRANQVRSGVPQTSPRSKRQTRTGSVNPSHSETLGGAS